MTKSATGATLRCRRGSPCPAEALPASKRVTGHWSRIRRLRRLHAMLAFGVPGFVIIVLVIVAVFAGAIAPFSPNIGSLVNSTLGPNSAHHLLGTDAQGRDILSRLIFGARYTLIVACSALVVGGIVGTALGLLAAYSPRLVSAAIMRTADAAVAFPIILLALLFAVISGPSFGIVISVVALSIWARFARLVYTDASTELAKDYVALAIVAGASRLRIVCFHVLPNILNDLVVMATLQISEAILIEAGLSFLGAGVPPPNPSWGSMAGDGRDVIGTAWWVATFPAMAILIVVLAFNTFGDRLRQTIDATPASGK